MCQAISTLWKQKSGSVESPGALVFRALNRATPTWQRPRRTAVCGFPLRAAPTGSFECKESPLKEEVNIKTLSLHPYYFFFFESF